MKTRENCCFLTSPAHLPSTRPVNFWALLSFKKPFSCLIYVFNNLPGYKMNDSRQQLLHILKTLGPRSTSSLANRLEMTQAGARKHLNLLQQDKLVTSSGIAGGVGRPDLVWRLTKTGHNRFPDTHDSLTLDLIGSIRTVFGEAGLDKLIATRETETTKRYARALSSARSTRQKIERLAELRSEEGYMAQAQQVDDQTWRLLENHCPVCAAARVCQGLCRSELAIFRKVLGKSFSVERDEYLLEGARRCSYRIQLLAPAPGRDAGL